MTLRTLAVALALCVAFAVPGARALTPTQAAGVDARSVVGARLPSTLRFRDERGREVTLGAYWVTRPSVLVLGYYGCSNLCGLVLHGVAASLEQAGLQAGRDADVVAVSIVAQETPALALARKTAVLADTASTAQASGWHFLTGDEPAIEALTDATGYAYDYDAASRGYAHPAGILIVAPGGSVRAQLGGVAFDPAQLRAGIAGTVQRTGISRWLLCFHDDPLTGRYTPAAMTATRAVGVATLLLLVGGIARAGVRARRNGRSTLS